MVLLLLLLLLLVLVVTGYHQRYLPFQFASFLLFVLLRFLTLSLFRVVYKLFLYKLFSLSLYHLIFPPSVYTIPARCPCSCNCFGLPNTSVNLNETGKGRPPRLIHEDSTCYCLFRCLRQYVAVPYEKENQTARLIEQRRLVSC